MRLRSLEDTHLEIDTVADDVHLRWLQVIEEVTVVPIEIAYGILVLAQSFLQQSLVVDVAFLHTEEAVQLVGSNDGVAHPCHVTQVIFLSFLYLDVDVDVLLVVVPDGVFDDGHVAIAQFVIFVYQGLLSLAIALVGELLRLEHLREFASLVNLAEGALAEERALDLRVTQFLVAVEDDVAHLHLRLLVDRDVENDLILAPRHVVALHDIYLCVLIALLVEVFLGQDLGTVNHIGCYLTALHDTEFGLHVLAFRLLQAVVVDGAHAWSQSQVDAQVNLRAYQ